MSPDIRKASMEELIPENNEELFEQSEEPKETAETEIPKAAETEIFEVEEVKDEESKDDAESETAKTEGFDEDREIDGEEACEEENQENAEKQKPVHICSLCLRRFAEENPAVLAMGHYGMPRYVCGECSEMLDYALEATDVDEIDDTVETIGNILSHGDPNDELTMTTVNEILYRAVERRKQIADGTWVESTEESADEGFDEIPEELRESEEDRAADERERASEKKFDRIWSYVALGVFAAAMIYILLKFFIL